MLLRAYLRGAVLKTRNDNEPFRWDLTIAEATEKLAHYRLKLLEFKLEIAHDAGIKHQAANEQARLKPKGKNAAQLDDEVPSSPYPRNILRVLLWRYPDQKW